MLDLTEMWSIAKDNKRQARSELDYSGYQFSAAPAADASAATALEVFVAYQNQSGWYYDPLSESYLRYVDTSDIKEAGLLHAETDRLTRRQLHVENVIVLFAKHRVVTPTNLDIHLDPGRKGRAILFRDGVAQEIEWRNVSDQHGDTARPIQFVQKSGDPAALKPGHTWVIVVTPESLVEPGADGVWKLTFMQPVGAQ